MLWCVQIQIKSEATKINVILGKESNTTNGQNYCTFILEGINVMPISSLKSVLGLLLTYQPM